MSNCPGDDRYLGYTFLYHLATFCPRIICLSPRWEQRSHRFGPWPKVMLPVWFCIVPCDPEDLAVIINGVLQHSTEYLIRRWAKCRAREDE